VGTTQQELTMAASIVIEEERGTYDRTLHPHNGYYAGDFRTVPVHESWLRVLALRPAITSTFH
jgi:hypothetical protein